MSSSYFLPGHDVRAMQTRVRQHLDIPLKFIQYVDARLAVRTRAEASGSPTGEIAYSSVASSPRQVAPGSRHPGRIWQRDAHLAIDRSAVILPPAMVSLLEESADSRVRSAFGRAAPDRQWLFPGSSPGRPASAGTILMAWRAAFGSPASLC